MRKYFKKIKRFFFRYSHNYKYQIDLVMSKVSSNKINSTRTRN